MCKRKNVNNTFFGARAIFGEGDNLLANQTFLALHVNLMSVVMFTGICTDPEPQNCG
jgi:hypothetical protein